MEYLNLNSLKHFYEVAKAKSFSRAATILNVQQPAISKTVKSLENDLGIQLFVRMGRSVELTREGEYIFSRAEEIFSNATDILRYGQGQDVVLKESLSIICNDIIATHILPTVFDNLRNELNDVRPIVSCGSAENLLNKILSDDASFGLFFHIPKLPSSLKVIKEFMLPFKVVVSAKFVNSVAVCSSFIGSREVEDLGNKTYPTIKLMQKKWPSTQIRFSTNNFEAHKTLVKKGMGVSVLPLFFVRSEIEKGLFRVLLEDEKLSFSLKIVAKKGVKLSSKEDLILRNIHNFVNTL